MKPIPCEQPEISDFILDPSLVLYLPLHQLDGSSFVSKDACGHLATVTGALWTPQGRDFDGTDDKIEVPHHTILDLIFPSSIELWLKHDRTQTDGWARMIFKNEPYCLAIGNNGVLDFIYVDTGGTSRTVGSIATVPDLTWTHIVVTAEPLGANTRVKCFLNGELESTNDSTGQNKATLDWSLRIMQYGGDIQRVKGTMGELRLYDRALTPSEVQHNYLATKWRYR